MANWTIGTLRKSPWRAFLLLLVGTLVAGQGGSSWVGAAAQEARGKFQAGVLESLATGEKTVWVLLHEQANLAPAPQIKDDVERGSFVYQTLRDVASRSQAGLRAELDNRGAKYKSFWILNAIRVTGTEGLLMDIAERPDVKAILADGAFHIPPVAAGRNEPKVDTVEWNIERIKAPAVWNQFNRGEGIVVANIDTGVHYTHPALVNQYRGNLGGGNFDHNFNWEDPSNICGNPSDVPCDNNAHGTHTMGTMVGDDGDPGPNQIGVAPHAKWIACKGCETNSCSFAALAACGQWVLAPTDLAGNNPNPALRPHVVNNSWNGGGGDDFYQAIVNSWVASGIFPAWSNGNAGPSCNTSGSPGDYVNAYSAGAFDINNNIAGFSSRGPSAFGPGEIKPNIAAPGVSVRSSVPPNGYSSFSGTSMAAPHVAGTVALIWSRSQTARRDIGVTTALLDRFARNTSNLTCGGTATDNNVWGEGKLAAITAVAHAPLP
jgi:subtilisin family serine protease